MQLHKISDKIETRDSLISSGKGIFAIDDIKKENVVFDAEELIIKSRWKYSLQVDEMTHLMSDNIDNFFNHSCSPNLKVELDKNNKARVRYIALRDIKKDEELFWNYNSTEWDFGFGFECNCGSENCVKRVRGMRYLSESQQNRIKSISTAFIKEKLKSEVDLIDEIGIEAFSKKHREGIEAWNESERVFFNNALEFVFNCKLPNNGKYVEIGVYKGESFLQLVKKYGVSNCIAIDVKKYVNLPNLIIKDIRKFDESFPVILGVNDLPGNCPKSKLHAHNWLCQNVVNQGLIVLTGHKDLDLTKYDTQNLSRIYKNKHTIIFKKLV